MDDDAHRDDTKAGAKGAGHAAGSTRRLVITALLGLDEGRLDRMSIQSSSGGGVRVTLHPGTLTEATSLVRAFGLSTRPDGVRIVSGQLNAVSVEYAGGAHLSGGLTVTWVVNDATALLETLEDPGHRWSQQ